MYALNLENNFVSADASGAIKSIEKNKGVITVVGTFDKTSGGVLLSCIAVYGAVKSSFYSKKKTEADYAAPELEESIYQPSMTYLKKHIDVDSLSLMQPSDDCLADSVTLPSSMSHLQHIGYYHNKLLANALEEPGDEAVADGDSPGQDNSDDTDPDYLPTDILEFFEDERNEAKCDSLVEDVVSSCSRTGFEYNSFLLAHPYESSNVNSTYKLFLDAVSNSAQSTSDVVSIVNGYINIIESNNEFTEEERMQLYGGMIVAVYSYDYWLNSLLSIEEPVHRK